MVTKDTKSGDSVKKKENISIKIYKLFCTEINLNTIRAYLKINLKTDQF